MELERPLKMHASFSSFKYAAVKRVTQLGQLPDLIPDFYALNGGVALQIDSTDDNIAELPQDVDSLKSIIARLISKT